MNIWNGFGSEHSYNLVMIGRFKKTRDAEEAKELIERIIKQVVAEPNAHQRDASPQGFAQKVVFRLCRAAEGKFLQQLCDFLGKAQFGALPAAICA